MRADDPVSGLDDLRGKTVGADYEASREFLSEIADDYNLSIHPAFGTTQEALDALIAGNIDGHIINNANPGTASRFLSSMGYGDAVKKGNVAILNLINAGIGAIQESGEMARLEEKWLR